MEPLEWFTNLGVRIFIEIESDKMVEIYGREVLAYAINREKFCESNFLKERVRWIKDVEPK